MTQNTLKKLRYTLFCVEGIVVATLMVLLCYFMPNLVEAFEQFLFDLTVLLVTGQVVML